ncbi:MAG: phage portal protein [Clostridia bacterium]|nr:phage portal protein [Clostridia bacterium]
MKASNENMILHAAPARVMRGRKQLFTNEMYVTDGNVLKILNDVLSIHQQNREDEKYLEKYNRGIQPVLDRVKKVNGEINNKIVVNHANQIVTFKTAEFAGEPIQYVSRSSAEGIPQKVADLNSLMVSEGKQSKDMELAYNLFTYGVGYRLVINDRKPSASDLFDEAPFEIYTPDPRNTFVVRLNDVSRRVLMGVTYVFLDDTETKVRYTVYTDNVTYTIDGTLLTAARIVDRTVHNFGMVTLIEYPCNPLYMGAFEVVLPLLDAINTTQSNRLDGIEQFIQAVMVFEGVDITREQFLELKDLGALKLPPAMDGRTSRVYYLNEQLDQTQTQTLVDDMYQTVLEIVGMPSQGNGNSSDSSNNGAMIVKNGWWNAEARSLETEGMWKAAETEFLKIILKICNDADVLTGLKVSDVEPKFGRRSYEDLLVKTQSFSTLRSAGCPAIQAFKFSKLSKDPEADALQYDQYQEEQAAELDEISGAATSGSDNTGGHRSATGTTDNVSKTGICPICHRTFEKRSNNQIYDREECRQKARNGGDDQ